MLSNQFFRIGILFLSFFALSLSACKAKLSPEAKEKLSQLESSGDLLVAKKIGGEIPLNPAAGEWLTAKEIKIPLVSQFSVPPRVPNFKKEELSVRALYNKKQLGLLLSWNDPTKDEVVTGAQLFADAVAVAFPMNYGAGVPLPYIGMGNFGRPMNILQWKASWQADIDRGFQGVEQTHEGMIPTNNIPQQFLTGEQAGSPLSQQKQKSSVENLLAEGFGTLTSVPSKDLVGKAVWQDGRWSVVINRPLKVTKETGTSLYGQGMVPISFAIWDGASKERNGLKSIARWRFLHLEEEAVPIAYLQSLVIGPLTGADPVHGKQLLTDFGCIACHSLPGNRPVNELGPDLTYAGAIHRPEYLLESIKDPNAVLVPAPGYFDPKTKTSTMPAFGDSLTAKNLNDMVEYLRSLQ